MVELEGHFFFFSFSMLSTIGTLPLIVFLITYNYFFSSFHDFLEFFFSFYG
jgi:hypothetical protein